MGGAENINLDNYKFPWRRRRGNMKKYFLVFDPALNICEEQTKNMFPGNVFIVFIVLS